MRIAFLARPVFILGLIVASSSLVLSMEPGQADPAVPLDAAPGRKSVIDALGKEEVVSPRTEQRRKELAAQAQKILSEVRQEIAGRQLTDLSAAHDAVRSDNTLLTSPNSYFGVYKRDIKEVGLFALDAGADYLVHTSFLSKRIDGIIEALIQDREELLHILQVTADTLVEWHAAYERLPPSLKGFIGVGEIRQLYNGPIVNYIAKNHSFMAKHGWDSATLFVLFGRWLMYKASDYLKAGLLPVAYSSSSGAYMKNEKGELVPLLRSPVAVVPRALGLIKRWYDPFADLARITPYSVDLIGSLCTSLSVPAPGLLYSDVVRYGLEWTGLYLGAKAFDETYTAQWTAYALKKRERLKELLLRYDAAVKAGVTDDVKLAKDALRKFVLKGHRTRSVLVAGTLGRWWQAVRQGGMKLPGWIGVALGCATAARAWLWYRSLIKTVQTLSY